MATERGQLASGIARRLDETLRALAVPEASPWRAGVTSLAALAATVGVVAIIFAALGVNPGKGFEAIWDGAFGNKFNFGQTVMISSMLMLTGLAAAIPFSARLWNIGGEGQLYFGAFTSVALALTIPAGTPHWLFASLCVVGGMVGGAACGLVPGVLKATMNANEMIVSLMMTFVAILVANYALTVVWPEGFASQTKDVPRNATLTSIWGGTLVSVGALLAVAAAGVAWLVMSRMRIGFEIRAIGLNFQAARMNGIGLGRGAVRAFAIGGAFAGLAGAINVLGMNFALISQFSRNFGYIGIAVALLARLNPAWIVPSALFFAFLRVGTNSLPAVTGLDPSIGEVLVATFVILLLATAVIRLRYAEAAR